MTAFAIVEELQARVDHTFDADEERIAAAALEDASDLARAYGRESWLSATSAPRLVRTLVLRAVARYMNNPEGFVQSRAGDETLIWSDKIGDNAGTVYFTRDEIALLAELAGKTKGFTSIQTVAWDSTYSPQSGYRHSKAGHVPVDYPGGEPFPLFSDDTGPW